MNRKLLPVLLVLALSVIACGFHVSVPINTLTPGPTVIDQINVPLPADTSQTTSLSLTFGAGTLKVIPGASALVSGTATYNIPDFKPAVTVSASTVRIEQGNWKLTGIPDLSNIKNEWDLSFGNQPLNLSIEAGAYHAEYKLGGLALTDLTVKDGASDVKMSFDSPNLAEMSLLTYETGASNVSITGLGNANFASLIFHSGAGNFTLDFTGALKRNGSMDIETGVSNMTLVIPSGVPVQLNVEGGLSNVTYDSGWTKNGNLYTQAGSGPQLTATVHIGAGNLTLTR
ncbi:MAG: toast rack family protein [Anaerolineales bacterium]